MRITIEPTAEGLHEDPSCQQWKVILEQASDEIDADDALDMVKRALVAWGYSPSYIFDKE